MQNKLSVRQRVRCAVIAVCVGAAYLGFCLYVVGGAWQRKEGDLPPISPLLQNASLFLVGFPFGFVPGLGNIVVAPLLNAVLWGSIAVAVYLRLIRRRRLTNGLSQ
jgi:uncharacterized membrane protein